MNTTVEERNTLVLARAHESLVLEKGPFLSQSEQDREQEIKPGGSLRFDSFAHVAQIPASFFSDVFLFTFQNVIFLVLFSAPTLPHLSMMEIL